MKSLFALGLPGILLLSFTTSATAQFGARSGALGGVPPSVRGMTRPLGGFSTGFSGLGATRNFQNRNFSGSPRRAPFGYPYAYSVWVPDYFDYLNDANQYSAPYYSPSYGTPYGVVPPGGSAYYDTAPAGAPGSQQPVIINQYFGAPGSQPVNAPEPNTTSNTQGPGDLAGSPQNYYLIAYKNHAVYAALAYWVEDKTLHYVTTQNTHNQASLDLIDITRTKSLNRGQEVPFSIPGQ
jgi:hypothetical protein